MRGILLMVVALTMAINSVQSYGFDLKEMSDSASRAVSDGVMVTGDAEKLVNTLTSGLGVNAEQAAGGSAALLSMAKNQLSAEQFKGVTDSVPGLSALLGGDGGLAASALSQVSSMEGVSNAFKSLGLSPDMITQFAPMILKFLGEQGVGSDLVTQLQGLWGAAG